MTRYPLKNKFKLIVLVTLVHGGPIEIGTYGAKCLLTNWKVFILFVYYVASLSSVALIHVFKMNGTSITKCFFNIIFDMKSFLSVLVISKSHDFVISLYRLINLCERYDSGILWSKSGRTALMWRDRSVLKHFAKNSHHLFEPSSLLDFFLQASPYSLYLLLKTMIIADLSASEIVSFFAHIFRLEQGRVSMLFSYKKKKTI